MRIKKLVSAFCLAAGLAFSVPALSSLPGITDNLSTVMAADGWQQDDVGWYYLQNDARLTGLQVIGGSTYYLNTSGYRVSGSVNLNGTVYYFMPGTGRLCTGYSGLTQVGEDSNLYYYFNSAKNGSVSTTKWVKHAGKYFYADENGQVKFGTIKVGSKLYHITKSGRMTAYGRSSYDKKYYYAAKNGVLLTGLRKINGRMFFFNKTTGQRQTGTVQVGSATYYFSTQAGYARTGWIKLNGKSYYYGKNYRRLSGLQTINKKKYYFNPKDNCARVENNWAKIGSHYYFFNSKGVLQSGFFTINGKTYFCSASGVRKKGWQTYDGHKYYMDKKTAVMKTGWFTYKNNKYYLNPVKSSSTYGAAKTGWVKISGSWYYFNDSGTMKTGWLLDNMKYYYLDKTTGKMYTGKHTIDGKIYDFGTSGGFSAQVSGNWLVKVNRRQCFVVVYKGNTEIKAFVCSTAADGTSTPTGTFSIKDKLYWHELMGPSWGQYCSHITSDILFHSVPNYKYRDPYSLETAQFNKLGTPASAGCIRLSVKHAKWLFENCPVGTTVIVSDSVARPKTVVIETVPKTTKSYDPTDTFVNPYSVR